MAKRKKRVSIYCQYCQENHDIDNIDIEELELEHDINIYCQNTGYQIWTSKEDKQKVIENMNN